MKKKLLNLVFIVNSCVFGAAESAEKPVINLDKSYSAHCKDGDIEISGKLILQSKLLSELFILLVESKQFTEDWISMPIFSSDIVSLLNTITNKLELINEINDIRILINLLNLTNFLLIDLDNNIFKGLVQQFIKILDTISDVEKVEAVHGLITDIQNIIVERYLTTYHLRYLFDNKIMSYGVFKELARCGYKTVAISMDNKVVVTGYDDKNVRIWNIETDGVRILNHYDHVQSIAMSSDNKFIVMGSWRHAIIWDMQTGTVLKELKYGVTSAYIWSIVISSDNKFIVTGSTDGVTIWNIQTDEVKKLSRNKNSNISSVTISLDNKYIAIVSNGGNVHSLRKIEIWDMQTNQIFKELYKDAYINSIAISPDNKYIVIGSNDCKIITWDIQADEIKELGYDELPINSVVISSDNKFIITVSGSHIKIWEVQTNQLLKELDQGSRIYCIAISLDNKFIITECDKVKVWQLKWSLSPREIFDQLMK